MEFIEEITVSSSKSLPENNNDTSLATTGSSLQKQVLNGKTSTLESQNNNNFINNCNCDFSNYDNICFEKNDDGSSAVKSSYDFVYDDDDNKYDDLGCLDLTMKSTVNFNNRINEITNIIENDKPIDYSMSSPAATENNDDVVFVQEYNLGKDKTPIRTTPIVPQRKNPRRKVQFKKPSESFSNVLELPSSIFNERQKRKSIRKCRRQSVRIKNQASNSIKLLRKSDFRDWPDVGMHERPIYNEATNSIDKLDPFLITTTDDSKNEETSPHQVVNHEPKINRKSRRKSRRKKLAGNKKLKEEKDEIDVSFLVHERLQLILGFVSQFKNVEYKQMIDKSNIIENPDRFAYELLADASILYSVVNGIRQQDLAKYLKSVDKTEALNFLDNYFEKSSNTKE